MMPDGSMPGFVVAFLRTHVDHLVKLRFILALHAAPSCRLSVGAAADRLDVPKSQIREMARELSSDDLARLTFEHVELTATIDDRLAIAELSRWYASGREHIYDVLADLGRIRRRAADA